MAPEVQAKKRKAVVTSTDEVKKARRTSTSESKKPTSANAQLVKVDSVTVANQGPGKATSRKTRPLKPDTTKSAANRTEKVSAGKQEDRAASIGDEEEVAGQRDPEDDEDVESEGEEEVEADDQTRALLQGFASSSDEDSDSDPEEDESGVPLPKLPGRPANTQLDKQLARATAGDDEFVPGVVYVGRIPHGFYEHQMRAYFSQFGDITRLRLSRNKKTGAPRHYAFIEFASAAVARIVAKAMNKYLLFGHILQVQFMPPELVRPDLFKGCEKKFKVIPRNAIERRNLAKGADRQVWAKRVENEQNRRKAKASKLKEMGYDFVAPDVRKVEDVPIRATSRGERKKDQGEEVDGNVAGKPKAKAIEAAKPAETIESITRSSRSKDGGTVEAEKVEVRKSSRKAKA